jgi:hypothetical protein
MLLLMILAFSHCPSGQTEQQPRPAPIRFGRMGLQEVEKTLLCAQLGMATNRPCTLETQIRQAMPKTNLLVAELLHSDNPQIRLAALRIHLFSDCDLADLKLSIINMLRSETNIRVLAICLISGMTFAPDDHIKQLSRKFVNHPEIRVREFAKLLHAHHSKNSREFFQQASIILRSQRLIFAHSYLIRCLGNIKFVNTDRVRLIADAIYGPCSIAAAETLLRLKNVNRFNNQVERILIDYHDNAARCKNAKLLPLSLAIIKDRNLRNLVTMKYLFSVDKNTTLASLYEIRNSNIDLWNRIPGIVSCLLAATDFDVVLSCIITIYSCCERITLPFVQKMFTNR